ncbi:restriction endonuclease subunit S [Bacteroides cellulosilyticus]|mgnify:CR=1 FL=1|jgi:type I restriction enzyme S subunit|uniref:restriction endonuclease subunit S n=1 Tax=Bacteroides cellulosilyticus TaxID=246787 RepID=UPI00189F7F4A|nr:restriction endonuclease subunit S [Bacteroides cellulosilyticus]
MAEPKIRFREYEGEYNLDKIGNLTDSYSGGTPSAGCSEYYGGKIPFIRSGEIHNDKTELFLTEIGYSASSAKMVEKGAILYAMYGATSGEVDVCKIKGAINQAILAINPQNDIDSYFLIYLLQNKKKSIISTFLQGGQGNLSGSMIKNITIEYPDIIEQQQIAAYFKSLDVLIQSTTKKIASLKQLKSASLISMFPQAGETKPRVRFKGFEGDWENINLSEVFVERHEISTITESLPQLSFTIAEGVIKPEDRKSNKRDFLIKDIDTKKYLVTYRDDIIYNPANVIYGAIHKNSLCNGVVSPIYKIFYTDQNADFMECIVRKPSFIQEMTIFMEGTVKKLKTLKPESFLKMSAYISPSLEEQKKIGDFFHSLNIQITLETQRLDKLKQIKSACLDKMFV